MAEPRTPTRLASAPAVVPVDPAWAPPTLPLGIGSREGLVGCGHRRRGRRRGGGVVSRARRMVERHLSRAFLLLGLAWLAWARPLLAEEARLRIVPYRDFAQVVLESPAARASALEIVGRVAQLRLDRPVVTSTLEVPDTARPFLLAVEPREEGARLALALAPDVTARLVEPGPGRIVLALAREPRAPHPVGSEPAAEPPRTPATRRAPTPTGSPAGPALRVRRGSHPGFERLVLEGPALATLAFRIEADRIEIVGPAEPLAAVEAALERLGSLVRRVTLENGETGLLRAELAAGAHLVRRRGRGDQVLFDIYPPADPKPSAAARALETPSGRARLEAPRPAGATAGGEAERGATATATDLSCARGTSELCVAIRATAESAQVVLDVEPRPGAAVLWRAGALWVVLDRPVGAVEIRSTATDGEALVRGVRREPHPNATLLRVETREPVRAEVDPSPRGWILRLRPGESEAAVDPARIVRLEHEKALAIEADARHVTLPATLFGGEVAVLAAREKLEGGGPRRFVDLEFLPATQGVAWRAISEDLRVRRSDGRWIFDRPGGLRLAPLGEAEGATPGPLVPGTHAAGGAASRPDSTAGEVRVAEIASSGSGSEPVSGAVAPSVPAAADRPEEAGGRPAREVGAAPDAPGGDSSSSAPASANSSSSASTFGPSPGTTPSPERSTSHQPGAAGGDPTGTAGQTSEPPIGLAHLAQRTGPGLPASVPGFLERRAGADPAARAALDRAFARAALARGNAAEALAFLGEPAAASDLGADPPAHFAARALAGAAAILSDRLAAGERLLDDPRLSGDPEVALWRAVAAARAGDWSRAARALDASERVFWSYPPLLQVRLAPLLARALVEEGEPAAALALLDLARRQEPGPREVGRLALVEGLALLARGAREAAASAFRVAARSGDPVSAVEARYRSARLAAEAEGASPEELLAELGRQRLLWRDHPAEAEMLAELAELTATAGRYGDALALAAELLARHPEAPRARRVAERRSEWLRAALEETGDGAVEALRALRTLRAHAEHLPEGEPGIALVREVARKLATAGLPGAASSVLVEHGLPRLAGSARAGLVLEAAELRLRAGDPDGALALLDREQGWDESDRAVRARREALRQVARAPGSPPGTIAALDPEARARLEAAWRARDWRTVVETGTSLLARGRSPEPGERLVALRVALALAAEGKPGPARELVERFGLEEDEAVRRVIGLLDAPAPLAGDLSRVTAAIDAELARLRAGLGRDR